LLAERILLGVGVAIGIEKKDMVSLPTQIERCRYSCGENRTRMAGAESKAIPMPIPTPSLIC